MPRAGDMFGLWTFLAPDRASGGYRWVVQCFCGSQRTVVAQDLRSGRSRSCGCTWAGPGRPLKTGKTNKTHGVGYECKEYRTWRNAKNRCYNPKAEKFPRYGERGVTMDETWAASYEAFLAGVGRAPSPKHSLDRRDNDKGYVPGNVYWATAKEQANNSSKTVRLTVDEQTHPLTYWAEKLQVRAGNIRFRLNAGWTDRQAIELDPPPPRRGRGPSKKDTL